MANSETEIDVLIVGGGISGCWFARQLHKKHPELSFRIVEATNRLGGRLKSDGNDGDTKVKDELGGMRIFPNKTPKVKALVDEFGLTLKALSLEDSNNLCGFNGKYAKKADSATIMPSGGSWEGKAPGEMASSALAAYKKTNFWTACNGRAYDCPELRNLSIQEFFKKYADGGATDDEIACWFSYGGYDLFHNDVQCSIWVDDGELYGAESTNHYFVHEGYNAVVSNLYYKSGATADVNTKVVSLKKSGDKVVVSTVQTGKRGKTETITAKKVILCMTAKQVSDIEGLNTLVSPERMTAISGSKYIPLFKAFLEFRPNASTGQPWYYDKGLNSGKSTSDTNARQMHYYDKEDILVYVSDGDTKETQYATYWGDKLAKAGSDKQETKNVLEEMWGLVKKIHLDMKVASEDEMPDPIWDECVHAYWPAGSHKWKKGVDVPKAIELITDGNCDGSSVYITGDAFCSMQGWVEGALTTNETAYAKAFPA